MNEYNSTIVRARKFLNLGNAFAYEDLMIAAIKECDTSIDKEYLIKEGKRDGYSFRHFGLRSPV